MWRTFYKRCRAFDWCINPLLQLFQSYPKLGTADVPSTLPFNAAAAALLSKLCTEPFTNEEEPPAPFSLESWRRRATRASAKLSVEVDSPLEIFKASCTFCERDVVVPCVIFAMRISDAA